MECIHIRFNGSQFRQVYSITHITINHSQTRHENTDWVSDDRGHSLRNKTHLFVI